MTSFSFVINLLIFYMIHKRQKVKYRESQKVKKYLQKLLTNKVFGGTISLSNEGSKQMERLNIDVNKLPIETYAQLVMIRAAYNLDNLEDAIAILADEFWKNESEDEPNEKTKYACNTYRRNYRIFCATLNC